MEFNFELFVSEKTGKKMVFVSANDGASGAEYPYETVEDIGKAVAAYISQYYPEIAETAVPKSILVTNIVWDTDDEVVEGLPDTYEIPFSEILLPWERAENFPYMEAMFRVTDALTEKFGFCIESLDIK